MGAADSESEFLKGFRAVFDEGNRAWNEGDIGRAYEALPPDFVYELGPSWPEAGGALHGRGEVVAFFEGLHATFPDIRTGPVSYIEAGEGRMITSFELIGTGRHSGTPTTMEIWQLWEVGDELRPLSVREFADRKSTLEAAGLEDAPDE